MENINNAKMESLLYCFVTMEKKVRNYAYANNILLITFIPYIYLYIIFGLRQSSTLTDKLL